MNAATLEADRIADAGLDAGKSLWDAVDAANVLRERLAFECALQNISEEIEDEQERSLFYAAAMKAIPIVRLSAEQRKDIGMEFDTAYTNLVCARQADERAAAADYYADVARENAA